ncbi:TetR/AcrR family transcriptional regulator [bacterium]|nr:TetR/AcrR family transcriptional regulator [bacterium]
MILSNEPEKKEAIKRVAYDLFVRFGFSKTSMEDIAKQCGISKALLYYYYVNKEAIFEEVLVDEATNFMNFVEKSLPENVPADEKIMLFFEKIYQGLKKYAVEMAEVPEIMCDHSPHGKPVIEKINQIFLHKLLTLLQVGRKQGLLDFENEEVTAKTLLLMTNFLHIDWIRRYPETINDKVVKTMTQIILNGLRRRN